MSHSGTIRSSDQGRRVIVLVRYKIVPNHHTSTYVVIFAHLAWIIAVPFVQLR